MRFARITVDPNKMDGMPCIRGLRIRVARVAGMVADAMTEEETLRAFPAPAADDVREALRYGAKALRERELPLVGKRILGLLEIVAGPETHPSGTRRSLRYRVPEALTSRECPSETGGTAAGRPSCPGRCPAP
jgi:uncharacterized protein (DUF433 family)